MDRDFVYYLRVRYGECDAQKVVFNARYGEYADLAVTEFFRALGYGAELASGELDYQLVRQVIEWKAPARFDQVVAIAVSTLRLGTTSFSLRCEFSLAGNAAVIATVETVYVLVDTHTLTKRALPEPLRAALQRGAPGLSADHAQYRASVSDGAT